MIHFGEELEVVEAFLQNTLAAKAHVILGALHAVIPASPSNSVFK